MENQLKSNPKLAAFSQFAQGKTINGIPESAINRAKEMNPQELDNRLRMVAQMTGMDVQSLKAQLGLNQQAQQQ